MTDKQLIDGMVAEIRNAPPIHIHIDANAALDLVGALQLVLRHPQIDEMDIAARLREIARRVGEGLSTLGPHLAEVVRRGWEDQGRFETLARKPHEPI
jgi:hypothetical protein